eukprot:6211030-Pleurochrysis_carterae.AAC.3
MKTINCPASVWSEPAVELIPSSCLIRFHRWDTTTKKARFKNKHPVDGVFVSGTAECAVYATSKSVGIKLKPPASSLAHPCRARPAPWHGSAPIVVRVLHSKP